VRDGEAPVGEGVRQTAGGVIDPDVRWVYDATAKRLRAAGNGDDVSLAGRIERFGCDRSRAWLAGSVLIPLVMLG
jgi:hypothetical protein